MKKVIVLSLCAVAVLQHSCSAEPEKTVEETAGQDTAAVPEAEIRGGHFYPEEFKKLLAEKNGFLLDVRTPEEFAEGTIEGAVNLNFYDSTFADRIAELDKARPTFVFCQAGGRSSTTKEMMDSLGFAEVYNLLGGYSDWPYQGE
jgi:rhodanese-related sulfurtransferase